MTIKENAPTGQIGAQEIAKLIISPFINRALPLLNRGWHVFPLKPLEKTPLTAHGFKDASNDLKKIKEWNRLYTKANIGIATGASGLIVIDCDASKGQKPKGKWAMDGVKDGMDVFATIAAEGNNQLPSTYTIKTPNDGWHIYFKADGNEVKSAAEVNEMWRVDVRANGGYIVAEGSVLLSGVYESGLIQEVITCPTWVHDAIKPKPASAFFPFSVNVRREEIRHSTPSGINYITKVIIDLRHSTQGSRNNNLNKAAYSLGKIVTKYPELNELAIKSLFHCAREIGLGDKEAMSTIKSAYVAGRSMGVAHV
jgi:hypothetical protein